MIRSSDGLPVHTFDVPGDGWTVVRWRPDGAALDYARVIDGTGNIWEQSLAGGPPKQITQFPSDEIFDFLWTNDKSKLLIAKGGVMSDVVLITRRHSQ